MGLLPFRDCRPSGLTKVLVKLSLKWWRNTAREAGTATTQLKGHSKGSKGWDFLIRFFQTFETPHILGSSFRVRSMSSISPSKTVSPILLRRLWHAVFSDPIFLIPLSRIPDSSANRTTKSYQNLDCCHFRKRNKRHLIFGMYGQ